MDEFKRRRKKKYAGNKTQVVSRDILKKKSVPKVCINCGKIYQISTWDIEDGHPTGVSHGLCPECFKNIEVKVNKNVDIEIKNKENSKGENKMEKYVCDICGYVYDPEAGDPDNGVAPGTAFEDLPADWVCPECGAGKDDFSKE